MAGAKDDGSESQANGKEPHPRLDAMRTFCVASVFVEGSRITAAKLNALLLLCQPSIKDNLSDARYGPMISAACY